ncbi:hypothetical protein EKG37_08545 [Robertmurraya yapensis]|uniref:Uncharacterized protein n=2 Tax=Bacillaceae TaxID=186817 RepID=A0A3S0KS24_9BACI|nr:hypothetical protein [Bacillus yapensis]RTR33097.1 hypothetical protein EKG37_08545 [Bacillus yapensis]TKS96920.1 hypothetical protein FAR12_08545 [Bacillus yapensis]
MKKLVVLLFTCFLLVGTAYASSNASEALSSWYKKEQTNSNNVLFTSIAGGIIDIFVSTTKQTAILKEQAASTLSSISLEKNADMKTSIESYHKNYQTQLLESTNNLDPESYFQEYTETKKVQLNSELDEDIESMISEVFGN